MRCLLLSIAFYIQFNYLNAKNTLEFFVIFSFSARYVDHHLGFVAKNYQGGDWSGNNIKRMLVSKKHSNLPQTTVLQLFLL